MNSGPAVRETLSSDDRLRKRREFEECYASGVRVSGRLLQIFLRRASERSRLGISVPRRVGAAVHRNRVRRRLRELFRRNRELIAGGPVWIVINARPPAASASFGELSTEYRDGVRRGLARLK